MNFEQASERLLEEIATTAEEMYAIGENEEIAYLNIRVRTSQLNADEIGDILALALMSLAANAMVTNERVQGAHLARNN